MSKKTTETKLEKQAVKKQMMELQEEELVEVGGGFVHGTDDRYKITRPFAVSPKSGLE